MLTFTLFAPGILYGREATSSSSSASDSPFIIADPPTSNTYIVVPHVVVVVVVVVVERVCLVRVLTGVYYYCVGIVVAVLLVITCLAILALSSGVGSARID